MSYKRFLASCFGLGNLPIAPGTWGSLPPVAVLLMMGWTGIVSPVGVAVVMFMLALFGSVVCVRFAPVSIAATGKKDPSEVVADEFAGQAVTFIVAGMFTPAGIYPTALIGFLLFRIFDIIKPWPLRKLEKLPQGWGILADDLGAGVYAGLSMSLIYLIWISDVLKRT
jgi:phosphatidylglycerophosphatase A